MKTLELNQYGLTEMNASELAGVDGGFFKELFDVINGGWHDIKTGLIDGFNVQ